MGVEANLSRLSPTFPKGKELYIKLELAIAERIQTINPNSFINSSFPLGKVGESLDGLAYHSVLSTSSYTCRMPSSKPMRWRQPRVWRRVESRSLRGVPSGLDVSHSVSPV